MPGFTIRFDVSDLPYQTWTVPPSVTSLDYVRVVGGSGGLNEGTSSDNAHAPGVAAVDVPVTPGQVFRVRVGGRGGTGRDGAHGGSGGSGGSGGGAAGGDGGGSGTAGGGGGGGGRSELSADDETSLLISPGAGGGGFGFGAGGGVYTGAGYNPDGLDASDGIGTYGRGGTGASGATEGTGGAGANGGSDGDDGASDNGGSGGSGPNAGGGGGGGGYAGGGGGGGSGPGGATGGGGGGMGSTYIAASMTTGIVETDSVFSLGDGYVEFRYTIDESTSGAHVGLVAEGETPSGDDV